MGFEGMNSASQTAKKTELCIMNALPTSSRVYDFSTEPAFQAIERCTAALTAETGESFVTITTASNTGNKYALAHLDFSDISESADKSVIEFDTRMNGGRWLIALADLSKRPGTSNKSSYDKTGTAFYFGTKDGTNLSINNELVWHSEAVGAWIHIKAVIDCKKRQLEYSITLRDTGAIVVTGTAAFSDTGCSTVTGIELYSWAQSTIDVDNVQITASSNINENNLYLIGSGDTYNMYFYRNGIPVLLQSKCQIITATDTTAALTPANNTEYRYGVLTSLSLTLSAPEDDYTAYIVFTSGETPTEAIYPDTLKWSGDDVIDGIFTPLASRRYNIGIWYDGEHVNAVARGVSV